VPAMSARLLGLLAVAATAVAIAAPAAASGGPQASESRAHCDGKAFSPSQRGKLLTSRGVLTCTGDVAKQRLRTCLEQQRGFHFVTVECQTQIKYGGGTIRTVVRHKCADSTTRAFRTRSFLFLRDVSGDKANGKAVSDLRVFPRLCG
jgi:hypothetical protein